MIKPALHDLPSLHAHVKLPVASAAVGAGLSAAAPTSGVCMSTSATCVRVCHMLAACHVVLLTGCNLPALLTLLHMLMAAAQLYVHLGLSQLYSSSIVVHSSGLVGICPMLHVKMHSGTRAACKMNTLSYL